jgi:hypothetical protein
VLTRNAIDFDFLNQMAPAGRILLYRSVGEDDNGRMRDRRIRGRWGSTEIEL